MTVANTSLFKRIVSTFTELASSAPYVYRDTALRTIPQQVGSKPSNLYGYFVYNPNTTDVFLKFWDSDVQPVKGVDAPAFGPLQVPTGGSIVLTGTDIIRNFSTLMWVGVSTDYADSGAGNPASNVYVHIIYKQ